MIWGNVRDFFLVLEKKSSDQLNRSGSLCSIMSSLDDFSQDFDCKHVYYYYELNYSHFSSSQIRYIELKLKWRFPLLFRSLNNCYCCHRRLFIVTSLIIGGIYCLKFEFKY